MQPQGGWLGMQVGMGKETGMGMEMGMGMGCDIGPHAWPRRFIGVIRPQRGPFQRSFPSGVI